MIRAALVSFLLITAGCTSMATSSPTEAPHTEAPTSSPVPTETPTETPTAEPHTPPPDNAWEADPITVNVNSPAASRSDNEAMVREALDYWENQTTGQDLNYTIDDDPNAHVTISFVSEVGYCGSEAGHTIGCADLNEHGETVEGRSYVQVERGYNRTSTVTILKHELGHTLGYDHSDDDIYPMMSETMAVTYVEQPDALDRESPWLVDELLIYVDDSDVANHEKDDYNEQVDHAIEWYETDEDSNLHSGTELTTTDNESAAHIVIDLNEDGDFNSTGRPWGVDNDEDPDLEYYTKARLTITGVEEDNVGWHVGHWFAIVFGAESQDELPEPFDDPENDDRDRWW